MEKIDSINEKLLKNYIEKRFEISISNLQYEISSDTIDYCYFNSKGELFFGFISLKNFNKFLRAETINNLLK